MSSQKEEIIEEYVEEVVEIVENNVEEKAVEEKVVEEKVVVEKVVEEKVVEEKVQERVVEEKVEEKVAKEKVSASIGTKSFPNVTVEEKVFEEKVVEEKATVEEKSDTSGETSVDQLPKTSILDAKQEIDYSLVDEPPAKLNGEEKKYVEKDDKPKISFVSLYRFATPLDCLLIFLGTLGATANGTGLPLMTIVFSGILQSLTDFQMGVASSDQLNDEVRKNVILFTILGTAIFVLSYFQMTCWMIAGENITGRLRRKYFSAVLRQDIAYFDSTITTGDVTSRISADISIFQEGISEKVGLSIQFMVTFITGFIIGYIKGWRLALVITSVIPLLAIGAAALGKALQSSTTKGQDAYAEAGSVAEQAISGIKTIASFGGQNNAIERYTEKLDLAYNSGKRKAMISGVGMGTIFFIMFSSYGLAFWYGSKLVLRGEQTVGQVLNTFFALIIGAFSIGNAAPGFSAITTAMGAATTLYAVIDRVPPIDSSSPTGKRLVKSAVKGRIEFKNVNFHYATRPDVPVLKNFNLTVEPGQTVALVGSSGSGKSTVVSLLERFYDPVDGSVCLDGEDLKNINIQSLRTRIGLVSQEPVLFPTSIKKNIKWGGAPGEKKPTIEEITAACKKSNAHDFIEKLPMKYDTLVGEKGALLSGGQKQRIAIARALIKDPTILLLDEATSALDADTERVVQQALDAVSAGRTTIVVAHRISTIKDADKIVVMYKGEVVEVGRHDELIAKQGRYYRLVKDQELRTHKKGETEVEEEDESESSTAGDTSVTIEEKPVRVGAIRRMSTKGSLFRTKTDEEIIAEEKEKKKSYKAPFRRIARLNRPELVYIILGTIGAMFQGAQMPLYAVIFTRVMKAFAQTDEQKFKHDTNFWAGMFIVLASVCLIGCTLQITFFSLSGEGLTRRLRRMAFVAIVRQEMAFFDEEKNGTGILTSKLAVDATEVQGLTGSLMGSIIQAITTVTFGLGLAFAYGWKLTLVVIAAMPIAGLASSLQLKTLAGFGARTRAAYEDSGQIVQQAVSNIRTIASLTREGTFTSSYTKALKEPHKTAIRGFALSAIGFAVSQGFLFFIWSLAFWYGTKLVVDHEYTVFDMMNVLFAVVFSAIGLGQISNFAPNTAKAKVAAISIFELIDRKSAIDPTDNEGKDRPAPVTGEAQIEKAHFRYPARPDVEVLRGLDMSALAGKTVALCGSSGSGKSTVVSLLLRFYDLDSGKVSVESVDIKDWSVEYLRSHMALVGQEPVLFDLTIGENIALAKPECTQDEIEASAKSANIHRFIEGLPDKYDTRVGEKGAQLSGGQKQRVAIARALIRNPKLLLLDEATSALDGEAEKVVQAALDNASQNRTTVTIAHRLSTIQNADLILVVKDGVVVERGKHLDLVREGGIYAKLVSKQSLSSKTKKS